MSPASESSAASGPRPHPRPEPYVYVLFGATGDLAKRKLLPGLYHLFVAGLLPEKFRIIGTSPRQFEWADDDFAAHAKAAIDQFGSQSRPGRSGTSSRPGCPSAPRRPTTRRRWYRPSRRPSPRSAAT